MPRVSVEYRSTGKDVFERFKQKHPTINITYTQWASVIYEFNYSFRDYLLETGRKEKFPYGFGWWAITKWRPKKRVDVNGQEIINLPVNWKKTKEYGKKIYHMNYNTEGFKFKWQWFYKSARFYKSSIWMFKPSRVTSRLLKHYLDIPDANYQYRYNEWSS